MRDKPTGVKPDPGLCFASFKKTFLETIWIVRSLVANARNLSLLTDLYQLTMAYAHWKSGTGNREAGFHLFFRRNPFKGGFAVACGLEAAIDYLRNFRFESDDLDY